MKEPGAEPVSPTMPFQDEPYWSDEMLPFFDGLIPEGWLLDIAEETWKLNPMDRFGLLLACQMVLPADKDDLALTVNGKNRNLRAGDFKMAASTMGLTEVQYRRISGKVISDVVEHLDEAIGRSFLSATSVARLRSLVAETLAALR